MIRVRVATFWKADTKSDQLCSTFSQKVKPRDIKNNDGNYRKHGVIYLFIHYAPELCLRDPLVRTSPP